MLQSQDFVFCSATIYDMKAEQPAPDTSLIFHALENAHHFTQSIQSFVNLSTMFRGFQPGATMYRIFFLV